MNTLSQAGSGGAIVIFTSTLLLATLTVVSVTTAVAPVMCQLERFLGLA